MAADYCSVDDIKEVLAEGAVDASYDALLGVLVTRASRAIDRFTGREPGAYQVESSTTRSFDGPRRCSAELRIGELATSPTSVQMTITTPLGSYTALAASDWYLWPYNAAAEGKPFEKIILDPYNGDYATWMPWPKAVKVSGKFGYSTEPPGEIVQAVITQTMKWFKRGQQAFADTGAVVDLGQLTYTKKLDPEVSLIIEHYRKLVV